MYPKHDFIDWFSGSQTLPHLQILATPAMAKTPLQLGAHRPVGKCRDGIGFGRLRSWYKNTGPDQTA